MSAYGNKPLAPRTAMARFAAREPGILAVWLEHETMQVGYYRSDDIPRSPNAHAVMTDQLVQHPELHHLVAMLRTCPSGHTELKAVFRRSLEVGQAGVVDRCALAMRDKGIYIGVLYRPGAPVVKSLRRWCRKILRNEARALGRGYKDVL